MTPAEVNAYYNSPNNYIGTFLALSERATCNYNHLATTTISFSSKKTTLINKTASNYTVDNFKVKKLFLIFKILP